MDKKGIARMHRMNVMAEIALMTVMTVMTVQYHPWMKKKGGYSPFSTIEFDADDKKSLFRESRASFLLYSQRNRP